MKRILFVINTLSRAGAETALLELLSRMESEDVSVDLLVLTGIGELKAELPASIRLLNKNYSEQSVLTKEGRATLNKMILRSLVVRGNGIRLLPYMLRNFFAMVKKGEILPDKLLWRAISDGSQVTNDEYDLAVAYLEGGSTYYVADHVKAKEKAAFVHVDYNKAGYTRKIDRDCYVKFNHVYTVSDEVKQSFIENYPELIERTEVFPNLLGRERILAKSKEGSGFSDEYSGKRILTIGRLTKQKAFEVSIAAMKILKEKGIRAKWYVLGDGDQREYLESLIAKYELQESFILLGKVDNPYPYLRETDLYVHASKFEGKSIAIQEAALLGCPILVSDCEGNREQITHDVDGRMCQFDSNSIAEDIIYMLEHPERCEEYGKNASEKMRNADGESERVKKLIEGRRI